MPAPWRDALTRLDGKIAEALGETHAVRIYRAADGSAGKPDPVTLERAGEPLELQCKVRRATGKRIRDDESDPDTRWVVSVFEPTVVIREKDWLTWGSDPRPHVVLRVRGLQRDADGSVYGARVEVN